MNFASVRYGKMCAVANFKTESEDYRVKDRCIVRTDRGKEVGEILTPPQPIPASLPPGSLGDLLRKVTPDDIERHRRLEREDRIRSMTFCREQVTKLNLPMKVIEVEHLFGGEKIVFYFVSETRVDFRELVKILAQQFRTRIELKQVGARDQARLCGDCGHCGLPLCCQGFKKELGGIQMEMAKIQKQTVDPSKVCGRCGKLLCCLSYEFRTYTEARSEFPPKGQMVETKAGTGTVLSHQLMQRKLLIQTRTGERQLVALADVLRVIGPAPPQGGRPQPSGRSGGGRGQGGGPQAKHSGGQKGQHPRPPQPASPSAATTPPKQEPPPSPSSSASATGAATTPTTDAGAASSTTAMPEEKPAASSSSSAPATGAATDAGGASSATATPQPEPAPARSSSSPAVGAEQTGQPGRGEEAAADSTQPASQAQEEKPLQTESGAPAPSPDPDPAPGDSGAGTSTQTDKTPPADAVGPSQNPGPTAHD